MAEYLLLLVLMSPLPPKLTVNPLVITQTDSVTLNCQTPSSVSVSQCYFVIERRRPARRFSCLKTLTGTELLTMSHQSSPAEVKVTCFYIKGSQSPESDMSSIIIRTPLPPKLTVNPLVITESDSVTLNCQTPSSVSVSQCYFVIERRRPARRFSCLKTLTGTELLTMSHQSSPAEVKVTCFYLKASQSPESDMSSIIIRTSLPPKLTVNPLVINEADSVTLNCQTPSSVSVSQCFFYTSNGGSMRDSSCLQTLTGTELLKVSNQNKWTSPAKVEVTCFYTVKFGNSPSPHSDTSSITIHIQTPQMTLQRFPGDYVLFTCSLPGSANPDTRCNLYVGEGRSPVNTTTTILSPKTTTTNQWFCQFSVTIDELLSRLHSVQQRDASCDYSVGSEPNSLSPRSDGYSLAAVVAVESHMTQTMSTFAITTGLTVSRSHTSGFNLPFTTPAEPASKRIWKLAAVGSGIGVTVGVILLALTLLCTKRRTGQNLIRVSEKRSPKRTQSDVTGKPVSKRLKADITNRSNGDREYVGVYDETYSIIVYEYNNE